MYKGQVRVLVHGRASLSPVQGERQVRVLVRVLCDKREGQVR